MSQITSRTTAIRTATYMMRFKNDAALGRIIEVVTSQLYDRFMAERMFQPLAMKDTFFFVPPDKAHRGASVYTYEALHRIRVASVDELQARIELYLKEGYEMPVVSRRKYKLETLSVL